jgi:signal transduction histidine kinase/CheY-like chemotaxis protein
MINFLSKWLALKPRIYLSLAFALISLLAIVSVNYQSLRIAEDELNNSNQFINQIVSEETLNNYIYHLHLGALNFAYYGMPSAADSVEHYYTAIRQRVYNKPIYNNDYDSIVTSLESYYTAFNKLRTLRERRDKILNTTLINEQIAIEEHFAKILDITKKANNNNSLFAAEAQTHFQQSINHGNNYLRSYDAHEIDLSRKSLESSIDNLARLRQDVNWRSQLDEISLLEKRLEEFESVLNRAVQITRGYLYLVNVILAAEANEIVYQFGKRQEIFNDTLENERAKLNLTFNNLFQWVVALGGLTFIFQAIFSYILTLSITRPITIITETFKDLAQGSGQSVIPRYVQDDEIGDLTNAAKMFKLKNIENRKVLNDYKKLSEDLEQRISDRTQELNQLNSELNIAKNKAEDMVRLRSAFIANVSHEIRTPINSIIGMNYLLRQESLTEQQSQYVDSVTLSSKKLLAMINDILDFSKIEAGKLNIEHIKLDLFEVVHECLDLVQAQAANKNIEIYVKMHSLLTRYYMGDPLRLGQVITNLLNNAIKFTPHGHVELYIEPVNIQRLRFHIIDTGIGISESDLKNLFQPFTQADTSTTRRYGGTGLGLVISQQIIQAMGGIIDVTSQEGIGTHFVFEIDLTRVHKEYTKSFAEKNALIIDKDDIARESLNNCLQMFGLEVTGYKTHQKDELLALDVIFFAVNQYQNSSFDKHVISLLRYEYPNVPICLVYPNQRKNQKSFDHDGQISKPNDPIHLLNVLNKLINHERQLIDKQEKILKHQVAKRSSSRFIIADDNSFNREVISGVLKHVNISIDEAIDGKHLLSKVNAAKISNTPYDMVFLDYHMPKLDGLVVCQQLRLANPNLVIVVMSGEFSLDLQDRFIEAGATLFLSKPVDINKLYNVIVEYLPATSDEFSLAEMIDQNLPQLDNLNIEKGLRYSGGDAALYTRLLHNFMTKNQQTSQQITDLYGSEQFDELHMLTHSLKSVAGSIGATELSEKLENFIQDMSAEKAQEAASLINNLMTELSSNLSVLSSNQTTTLENYDSGAFTAYLEQLKTALNRRRPREIQPIIAQIESIKIPDDIKDDVTDLCDNVNQFNYNDAIKHVENLLNAQSNS